MTNLAEGWRPLNGISGSGWDIWLGMKEETYPKALFAIFFRRCDVSPLPEYTMGKPFPGNPAFDRMKWIKRQFHEGKTAYEHLFAEDIAWLEEQAAEERRREAYRALPTYGLF